MEYELFKTTLSAANKGVCKSGNNSRFQGSATCWTVRRDGEDLATFKRKRDAEAILFFCKSAWDGKGEVVMAADSAGFLPEDFKGEC